MNNDEFKQLSAAARRANLLDYFQNSGYTVEKKGAEYYIKEFSGLCVNPDRNLWFHHYSGKGGSSSIDCLVQVLGRDFKQAVFELTGKDITTVRSKEHTGEYKPQYTAPPKPDHSTPEKRELQMPEQSKNMRQLFAYMCQSRKIPAPIIEELVHAGLLYQSERMVTATTATGESKTYRNANAVFVHKDAAGKVVGGEIQGLNSFKRYKGIATGTGESAFIFHPVPAKDGKIHRAYIFESAIDLMSFYKFCDKKKMSGAVLVSMAGLKPTIPLKLQAEGVEIFSCVDNDDAGRRFEKENGFVRPKGVIEQLDKQGFKDWNELLVFKSSNLNAHLERQQPEPELLERTNQNERPNLALSRRMR